MQELSNSAINPEHYRVGGVETIDYIQAKLSEEQFEGYLAGNVMKYISRYRYKNGLEDLQKAQWYLSRLVDHVQSTLYNSLYRGNKVE